MHTSGAVNTRPYTRLCNIRSSDQSMAFTGDTVLIRGCGRTDFQGGSAQTLHNSVMREIFSLPDSTVIWPGHDYSGRTATSVGEEKAHNPRLSKSKEDFVDLMNTRFDGSKYPDAIDWALPANMVCGVFGDGKFDPDGTPVLHPGGFVWKSLKPPRVAKHEDPKCVSAHMKLPGAVILDFRGIAEVEKQPGFVGCINLPSTPANAAQNVETAVDARSIPEDKDTPIVLYCASGNRAGLAAARLTEMGYGNCVNGGSVADVALAMLTH